MTAATQALTPLRPVRGRFDRATVVGGPALATTVVVVAVVAGDDPVTVVLANGVVDGAAQVKTTLRAPILTVIFVVPIENATWPPVAVTDWSGVVTTTVAGSARPEAFTATGPICTDCAAGVSVDGDALVTFTVGSTTPPNLSPGLTNPRLIPVSKMAPGTAMVHEMLRRVTAVFCPAVAGARPAILKLISLGCGVTLFVHVDT